MADPAAIVGRGPVLCLAPHPDDESLGCGALLAACWRDGIPAHVVCLTDGAASHPGSRAWPRDRLAALRHRELEDAVSILGGDPERVLTFFDHPDAALHMVDRSVLIDRIARLVDRLSIGVVLAPSARDPHCDHVAAAAAAMTLCRIRPDLRLLSYPIWSRWVGGGQAIQEDGANRHEFRDPDLGLLKAFAISAHESQSGGVIQDDPDGFAMPDGFAAMFIEGPEIFDEPKA